MTDELTRDGTAPDTSAGVVAGALLPSHAAPRTPEVDAAGASAPSRVSIFGPDALQRALDAEFAAIPPGKTGALVGYYTTDGTWRVAVATRVGDRWQLGAVAQRDAASGLISGGVQVKATW